MPTDYAAVATIQCYFHSPSHNTNPPQLFTIFSSSEFSPLPSSSSSSSSSSNITRSNANCSFVFSRHNLSNGKYIHQRRGANPVSEIKNLTTISSTVNRIRTTSLWKQLISGSKKFRGIILLNVITIVYASNIAIIKEVEAFTDPAYFSAVRFAVSSIPFLPFIFQARNDSQTRNSGLELGLWVSLGYLSEALGLLTSDAGRASFISLFTVLVVPLLESMLGEIVPARTWFGILMSVIGIGMLECSGSPPNIGDLFNFVSAIFFGIHTLRTEHISRKTRKEDLLPLLGYEVCVVAALSTLWCVIGSSGVDGIQDSEALSWTWGLFWDSVVEFPWIPALYTGVFSTGLCLWGEIAAMQEEVSAIETSVIYAMEPLWGACFAWFLLGERWGVAGWIGAAFILGGSLMAQILGGENESEVAARERGSGVGELVKDKDVHGIEVVMASSSSSSPSSSGGNKTLIRASPVMVRDQERSWGQ